MIFGDVAVADVDGWLRIIPNPFGGDGALASFDLLDQVETAIAADAARKQIHSALRDFACRDKVVFAVYGLRPMMKRSCGDGAICVVLRESLECRFEPSRLFFTERQVVAEY